MNIEEETGAAANTPAEPAPPLSPEDQASSAEALAKIARQAYTVDSVLLIDGDNDPHLPPDFPITDRTLVRVFLRPLAVMPRTLERRLGRLPMCVSVVSPKGGANSADFVMSLHAGVLHSTLPLGIPFTLVSNDKSLGAMAQELQRIGRRAELWTSHPDPLRQAEDVAAAPSSSSRARGRSGRSGGRSRGGGRGRTSSRSGRSSPGRSSPASRAVSSAPSAPATPPPPSVPASTAPAAPSGKATRSLADVAASYAARLKRVKNPPSRLKALLNDIKNRAVGAAATPEEILEVLKRSHGVSIDEQGRVRHA